MIGVPLLLAAAAAAPLQPNGNWSVAFEDSMCLASRKFGPNGDTTLLLRPSPLNETLELTVRQPSKDRHVVLDGKASVANSYTGTATPASYMSFVARSGDRSIVVQTNQSVLEGLADEGALTVETERDGTTSFSMRQVSRLMPVIADCKRKVAVRWGVPAGELDSIARRAEPIGDRARWISVQDYPDDALRKHQSGTNLIVWTIGLDGRASDCRVIVSSGVPSLDRASCSAIARRARYRPAKDKAGNDVVSHDGRRTNWITPS
jgi:TonB family protein